MAQKHILAFLVGALAFGAPRAATGSDPLSSHPETTENAIFECRAPQCPGASLLIPYFEVDLGSPSLKTTLFSIANAVEEPVLARVVVWTNWGLPVLGFNVLLGPSALRSVDLGDLVSTGTLPRSAPVDVETYPGCAPDLVPGPLDPAALETLVARLAGKPDPQDGLCYAGATEPDLLTGYLTVDAVNDCSDTALYPLDEGYFADDGQGVASDRNVLWGDVFLLDASKSRAEGFAAVALIADASRFGPGEERSQPTFYGTPFFDHRTPLNPVYRTRFFRAGAFETDLLVWTEGQPFTRYPTAGPLACDQSPQETFLGLILRPESAGELEWLERTSPLRTQRIKVGEIEALPRSSFGTLDVCTKNRAAFGLLSPPTALFQSWVIPAISFGDRSSLGSRATPVDPQLPCR